MQKESKLYLGDCLEIMPQIETDSIDAIVTDPPYGISFMGKDWDKAVPSIAIWKECLRVLKPGAFAFVMCIPRQDCLARMICRLEDAGFNVAFSSIYWTYATGFPKAQNLSKVVDKRAGVERNVIGIDRIAAAKGNKTKFNQYTAITPGKVGMNTQEFSAHRGEITEAVTEQAKALDGAYGGFQPKPAVEVVIVAMKPLSAKTYLDQALKNGHGCTWLDDCRIPFESDKDATFSDRPNCYNKEYTDNYFFGEKCKSLIKHNSKGRFPANVLCEDDVLSNGNITKSTGGIGIRSETNVFKGTEGRNQFNYGDSGSFSRYFSLDAWFAERIKLLPKEAQKTFPWLIVPKASKREKNRGLDDMEDKKGNNNLISSKEVMRGHPEKGKPVWSENKEPSKVKNNHPTTKPLKLMTWLIILGTQEGDIVLDPFMGSGATPIAAKMTHRYCKGIEREKEFFGISVKRIDEAQQNMDSFL